MASAAHGLAGSEAGIRALFLPLPSFSVKLLKFPKLGTILRHLKAYAFSPN
jgi:hypothetical protein